MTGVPQRLLTTFRFAAEKDAKRWFPTLGYHKNSVRYATWRNDIGLDAGWACLLGNGWAGLPECTQSHDAMSCFFRD